MYTLLNELKSKLHINYYLSPRTNGDNIGIISEEHGINTNIMIHCEDIVDNIIDTMKYAVESGADRTTYIDNSTQGLFFQKLYIRFNISYSNKFSVSANYSAARTYINKEDKKFGEITIYVDLKVPQIGNFNIESKKNVIIGLISHELNHAFEHYNRYFNGKKSTTDIAAQNGYFKNNAMNNNNEELIVRKLSFVLYHLYNFEVNAYVAEIIQEIRPELADCENSEMAWNVARNSNIMKKYLNVESYINEMKACKNNPELRDALLNYYNSVRQNKVSSFDIMIKILQRQWVKARKQLVDRLSKQITDIAMQSNKWGYLDGPKAWQTGIE